jgi:hypothetical protein
MSRPRRYFSGDEEAEIRHALGCQVPLSRIAAHYGCSVEDLQVLLGIPQFKAVPDANSEPDLFAGFDRLQEQL